MVAQQCVYFERTFIYVSAILDFLHSSFLGLTATGISPSANFLHHFVKHPRGMVRANTICDCQEDNETSNGCLQDGHEQDNGKLLKENNDSKQHERRCQESCHGRGQNARTHAEQGVQGTLPTRMVLYSIPRCSMGVGV